MRYILIVFLLFLACGCNEMESYDYSPYKNVELQVNLKNANYSQKHKATLLYFDLEINNDGTEAIYFDPGQLRAKINSINSQATYYDSLASVMPERELLTKGNNNFKLYFVLPGVTNVKSVNKFEILNFGLDKGKTTDIN